ncbi:small, acid-soluble spore protein, alpha/beta type [Bacillus songklensis]|uniref:Small, acid-soluble spore protein, alpha/beta type n=1 Tax=Bacillus songklensis TaxID=1069116 RepID=A0ABV8B3Q2_9BACI
MARRRRLLVPEAQQGMDQLKESVMKRDGYQVSSDNPNDVKYEVAKELNIPLQHGRNGHLTSVQAGKIGGQIGGRMVKELIKMAQETLNKK